MKERILTGWNLARVLYFLLGTFAVIQSVIEQHWLGVAIGGYFAAMGIFRFGCAAGNCVNLNSNSHSTGEIKTDLKETVFEEIK